MRPPTKRKPFPVWKGVWASFWRRDGRAFMFPGGGGKRQKAPELQVLRGRGLLLLLSLPREPV